MKSNTEGIVYLVGAGSGDPDLITCKGAELLKNCDAVIYDDLIPWELIAELPEQVQKHYVGKRSGYPSFGQDYINRLLVDLARKGLKVVRLKGGDPLIFSRGGEEIDTLVSAGIMVEIVPGVTAASTAAAVGGFPLTDRREASWLVFATGHSANSASPPVPWEELGQLKGGSIAIYMGLGALPSIVTQLTAGGMDCQTPVVVMSNVGSNSRRSVYGNIADIVDRVQQEKIEAPAMVMIGRKFTEQSDRIEMSFGSLQGKCVLTTHPIGRFKSICKLLRNSGAIPIPLPTFREESFDDVAGWKRFEEASKAGGWCLFSNQAGVENFFKQLLAHDLDFRVMGQFKIASTTKEALQALRDHGFNTDLLTSETSVARLESVDTEGYGRHGNNLIRVCGNCDDTYSRVDLNASRMNVITLPVYRTVPTVWEPHREAMLKRVPPDYIIFSSSASVRGFLDNLDSEQVKALVGKAIIIAAGQSAADALRDEDIRIDIATNAQSDEEILNAITISMDCKISMAV